MILAPNNCPCSANHRDYLEIDAIAYSGIAILTLSFSSPKSKHADSELPEHVKCQTHDARKQEFRALTEPFTTSLKTVINLFVLAVVPTLTPQPPHRHTINLQSGLFQTRLDNTRPLFSPVSTERSQVLPDLSPVTQSLPLSSIEIRTILQQVVNNAVRTALDDMLKEGRLTGPPGPLGATTAGTSTKFSPKEIGLFNPRLGDREGKGDIVQIGSDTYIQNVYHFVERTKDTVTPCYDEEVKANITQCASATSPWNITPTASPPSKRKSFAPGPSSCDTADLRTGGRSQQRSLPKSSCLPDTP